MIEMRNSKLNVKKDIDTSKEEEYSIKVAD